MEEQDELGERKARVLRAIVEEYVRTGEPVGSQTIAEGYDLGVSPATIRNEMAALEELGYLDHPHTSAGRIPTDRAYREFVNSLPAAGRLGQAQSRAITDFFAPTVLDLEEALRGATQLLSKLTRYAGLALPPSITDERVAHVELVGIGSAIMVLVVGQHGRVDKRVLDRPDGLDDRLLLGLSGNLASVLGGLTVAEAKARALQMALEASEPDRVLLTVLADAFGELNVGEGTDHVLVGGVANLASEAEAWHRETIHRLIEALERESEMLQLLREAASSEDLSVMIGGEHPSTGQWEASVVAAPYRAGDTSLGTIGIVGPTRMDYLTAISTVRAVARRISELATSLGQPR
ncbi:MAG: heat-inducible transcriptional repressor HrcA [Actinomycetota bacterium]